MFNSAGDGHGETNAYPDDFDGENVERYFNT